MSLLHELSGDAALRDTPSRAPLPGASPFSALNIDLYELTMMQGLWLHNTNPRVVCEMFFRRQPYQGGFSVCAGLDTLIAALENLRFCEEELDYLISLNMFKPAFIEYLRNFRFQGEMYGMAEGTVVFPYMPLLRVHASLIETLCIEGVLLNTINFQTLIATKAARIYLASKKGRIIEMGLRRAQGINGALSASRAAYIGGCSRTSNTMAGYRYGIPVSGTMAHSWVLSFRNEVEAFRRFAEIYPNNAVFLIDTYSTLRSGIDAAITVGLELKKKGYSIGVRLDSGDIQYFSSQVRRRLNESGLRDAKIIASNELNEEIISQLVQDGAPVDGWGIGTSIATGAPDASFSGIYKMVARARNGKFEATMKISDNPEKSTNPGIKQVYRFYTQEGILQGDLVALCDERIVEGKWYTFHHPYIDNLKRRVRADKNVVQLLRKVMEKGRRIGEPIPLDELRSTTLNNLEKLDPTHRRIINPHIYKVSISDALMTLKHKIVEKYIHTHEKQ